MSNVEKDPLRRKFLKKAAIAVGSMIVFSGRGSEAKNTKPAKGERKDVGREVHESKEVAFEGCHIIDETVLENVECHGDDGCSHFTKLSVYPDGTSHVIKEGSHKLVDIGGGKYKDLRLSFMAFCESWQVGEKFAASHIHVVSAGESLEEIADRYFNDYVEKFAKDPRIEVQTYKEHFMEDILRSNKIKDSSEIKEGRVLFVPGDELEESMYRGFGVYQSGGND